MPKVSVIIPTYNHKEFILAAVESAVHQTYTDVEILVADDASTDGTSDIVRKCAADYPDRVKALVGHVRLGIAGNMNRGLKVASGEYVAWLGGDDLMYPTKLAEQVAHLNAHPELAGCHHDAAILDEERKQIVGLFSELYSRGTRTLVEGGVEILFDAGSFMLPSTMMFRRSAAPAQGFDERLRYANDWLFDIDTFHQGRIGAISKVLGAYRRHGNNVTDSGDLSKVALEEHLMVMSVAQARYPQLTRLIKKRRMSLLLAKMVGSFRRGEYTDARAFMSASFLEGAVFRAPVFYTALCLFGKLFFSRVDVKAYRTRKLVRIIRNRLKV